MINQITLTHRHARETGLVFALVSVVLSFVFDVHQFLYAAAVLTALSVAAPGTLMPVTRTWFGLAITLNRLVTPVVLATIYVFMVVPVGLVRRACKLDSLGRKEWNNCARTRYNIRNHKFRAQDLSNPY